MVALAAGVYVGKLLFTKPPLPPPVYRQLTFRRGSIRSARFAPDGQTILYSAAWQGSPVDVFTARPEAPEARSMGLTRTQLASVSSASGDGRSAQQQSHRHMGEYGHAGAGAVGGRCSARSARASAVGGLVGRRNQSGGGARYGRTEPARIPHWKAVVRNRRMDRSPSRLSERRSDRIHRPPGPGR